MLEECCNELPVAVGLLKFEHSLGKGIDTKSSREDASRLSHE
jgi:hypothetical protein